MNSYEVHGKQIKQTNVGAGWTKFFDPPGEDIVVFQIVVTTTVDATVQFGGPGAPASPEFALQKGIPLVLPYTERGWWAFDGSADVGVNVASAGAADVAILAMIQKG